MFGQKPAGSLLGSMVRAVARFFARLTYPVHVAAWEDDLIFVMSTPAPLGLAGGERAGGGGAEGRHDFPETQAASQPFPLADFSVLICSYCVGAISALRKESFRSPALQNGALLHNCLFMDLGAMPPLYLHAPGFEGGGRRLPLSGDCPGSAGVRVVAGPAARGHGQGDPPRG